MLSTDRTYVCTRPYSVESVVTHLILNLNSSVPCVQLKKPFDTNPTFYYATINQSATYMNIKENHEAVYKEMNKFEDKAFQYDVNAAIASLKKRSVHARDGKFDIKIGPDWPPSGTNLGLY